MKNFSCSKIFSKKLLTNGFCRSIMFQKFKNLIDEFVRKEITHMKNISLNNTMMMMCNRSMMMFMVNFRACYVCNI